MFQDLIGNAHASGPPSAMEPGIFDSDDSFLFSTLMMNRDLMLNRDMQQERAHNDRMMLEHQKSLLMLRMLGGRRK